MINNMEDFFLYLQRLSQEDDSGVEVFIDEDGEIEFEIEEETFEQLLSEYDETKNK
jgi:hypothetical protein